MTFPRMTLDDGTVLAADVCRTCGGKGTIPAPTTYTVPHTERHRPLPHAVKWRADPVP